MDNSYLSSPTDLSSPTNSEGVSLGVLQVLGATKPWVRLCSIIGFVFTALILLVALVMLFAGGAIFAASAGSSSGAVGAAMPVIMCLVYVAMAALYFFPSLKL